MHNRVRVAAIALAVAALTAACTKATNGTGTADVRAPATSSTASASAQAPASTSTPKPAPPSPTQSTAASTFERDKAIVALAPHAYTGRCGNWQLTPERVPVPCANLAGMVLPKQTNNPNAMGKIYIGQWSLDGTKSYEEDTDKLMLSVSPTDSGDWVINWQVKPGIQVEWLLATYNAGNGVQFTSAHTGQFVWHSGKLLFPDFSIYANDINAPPGPPVGITGPPVPHP